MVSLWWRITSMISELKQGNRRQHDVVLMGDLKEMTWHFGSAPSVAQGGK
jgi:hypothetical protein